MALMAPTQASPAPHPNDFHPDFPNLRNLHCQHWRSTLSLKNTCSPPNGPGTTPPGILRPFSVDINKPQSFPHTTLSREKEGNPLLIITQFSLSTKSSRSIRKLFMAGLSLPNCQVGSRSINRCK